MKRGRRLPVGESCKIDPLSTGPVAAGPEPAAEESPFAIFEKVHRLLRGRYHWAISLGLLGAILGGTGGYLATQPTYQSTGSIHVAPMLQRLIDNVEWTQPQPLFNSFVRTRANLLQDPRVLDAAMNSDAWRALGRGFTPDERERFRDSLRVTVENLDPEWIYVRFTDRDPKAAKVAVEEIINAYVDIHGAADNVISPENLERLRQIRGEHERRIASIQREIAQIGSPYGTSELGRIHDNAVEELHRLEQQVTQMEWQLANAEERLARELADEDREGARPGLPIHEIANHDNTMRALLVERTRLRSQLEEMETRLGESHRDLRRARQRYHSAVRTVERYAEEWLSLNAGELPGAALGAVMTAETVEQVRAQLEATRPLLDVAFEKARRLNRDRSEVERLRTQLRHEQERLQLVEHRLNALLTEGPPADASGTSPRINIVSRGELPNSPAIDNRRKLGALGVMFGGGLPVGLILLLGLMDRRYRYADDASADGKVALLGVLPYLPDATKDPEQAAIAAHCVHQIRTLLQISAVGQSRKVFAVSSPTAGDGKTSLSLSLGLSFAASGARTCLIDFDMVGAGLTAAMQVKADVGLLDAIEEGHLNGHVRSTSYARLSLVPVGENDAQEISRLSPSAVRRVLDQARDEFDIVIVDTGPILGSIEAALVCAEADGVVMTIGRGQDRSVAERAINHLSHIGAKMMGVVFNRANGQDFQRTIASTSVRSVPFRQNGSFPHSTRSLPALGPMASTVATQAEPPTGEAR